MRNDSRVKNRAKVASHTLSGGAWRVMVADIRLPLLGHLNNSLRDNARPDDARIKAFDEKLALRTLFSSFNFRNVLRLFYSRVIKRKYDNKQRSDSSINFHNEQLLREIYQSCHLINFGPPLFLCCNVKKINTFNRPLFLRYMFSSQKIINA